MPGPSGTSSTPSRCVGSQWPSLAPLWLRRVVVVLALVLDVAWHHCQLGMGRWRGVKSFRNPGFAGRKSEAVIFSSIVLLEALAIVFSSPWNSGQSQACDTLVMRLGDGACILGWACLMAGERFGPMVETWRVSSPGEGVKEAQSLRGESVWSSPRKRDRADLSLGRGFIKGHPQWRGSESISPWG